MKKLLFFAVAISLWADNFVDLNPPVRADSMIPEERKVLPPIEPIFTEEPIVINEPPKTENRSSTLDQIGFWVQVGAYEKLDGAKSQERLLRSQGETARIFSSELHRVAVGPYSSKDAALKKMIELQKIDSEAFLTTTKNLQRR